MFIGLLKVFLAALEAIFIITCEKRLLRGRSGKLQVAGAEVLVHLAEANYMTGQFCL